MIRICPLLSLLVLFRVGFPLQAAPYDGRFLDWAEAYAVEMCEQGRDRYGAVQSPLFVSMLQRAPTSLLASPKQSLPNLSRYGIRQHDRSWNAGNPLHDVELYQLLYELSEYSGNPSYAEEADKAIAWFFSKTQHPKTGLLPWGEHTAWDVEQDTHTTQKNANKVHEMYAWPFWERSFALESEAAHRFALGLWNHQVLDQGSGDFNRHCRYDTHRVESSGNSFPRYGGNMIRTWAASYHHSKDPKQKRDMLRAISTVSQFLNSRRKEGSNAIPAGTGQKVHNTYWPSSNLELATELAWSVDLLPQPERGALLNMLRETDEVFLSLTQDIAPGGKGFLANIRADTLEVYTSKEHSGYTSYWSPGYGNGTAADMALMMLERAAAPQLSSQQRAQYRIWAVQAADRYLEEDPPGKGVQVPAAYAAPIRLLTQVYEGTKKTKYLERARDLADQAYQLFLEDASALPKVSSQHSHYESISGGDNLMLAFFKLHRAIQPRQDD